MCQASVGKVVKVGKNEVTVESRGREVALGSRIPDVKEGDYVLVSGKIAVDKIDEEEARILLGNVK
jgi:hydrogenase maturation factor